MNATRELLRDWFGREGLKPEDVEIFHRCCDELEQAIKADTQEECRVSTESELRVRERDQAIALLDKVQEDHGILIGLWLHRNPDKYPDLSACINKIALGGN